MAATVLSDSIFELSSALILVLATFFIAVMTLIMLSLSRYNKLAKFKAWVRVTDSELILPTQLGVGLGHITISFYRAGRSYSYKVSSTQIKKVEFAKVLKLDELCSSGFYAIAEDDELLIHAPGFMVTEGVYKGIVGVCIDPSKAPVKRVMLSVKSTHSDEALREATVVGGGFAGKVSWIYQAEKVQKIIYDEKRGVYSFLEEPVDKPRARAVRLEVCGKASSGKEFCREIAVVREPGGVAEVGFTTIGKRMPVFTTKNCGICIQNLLKEMHNTLAGYAEGRVRAKLVMDIPLGVDLISTEPL